MTKEIKKEKMVGAQLSNERRLKLAEILRERKRTFRAQLECWIDDEWKSVAGGR